MDIIRDPSLVLDLPLYKLDGTKFKSQDAYGHLCTVTDATWGIQGRTFDGTGDGITLPSPFGDIDFKGQALSVGIWINFDVDDTQERFFGMKPTTATNFGFQIIRFPSTWVLFLRADDNTTGRAGVRTDDGLLTKEVWRQIFVTYSGSGTPDTNTVLIYLNGAVITDTSIALGTAAWEAANNTIFIGDFSTQANDLEGKVGEVWVYNRVLTPQEIQRNFLATKWRYR